MRHIVLAIQFLCIIAIISMPVAASRYHFRADVRTVDALRLERTWAKDLWPDDACIRAADFECLSRFLWDVMEIKRGRFANGVVPADVQQKLMPRHDFLRMMVKHGQYEAARAILTTPGAAETVPELRIANTSLASYDSLGSYPVKKTTKRDTDPAPLLVLEKLHRNHRLTSLVHQKAFAAAQAIADTYEKTADRTYARLMIADALRKAGDNNGARDLYLSAKREDISAKCLTVVGQRMFNANIITEGELTKRGYKNARIERAYDLSHNAGDSDAALALVEDLMAPFSDRQMKLLSDIYRRAGLIEKAIDFEFKGSGGRQVIYFRKGEKPVAVGARGEAEREVKVSHMADLLEAKGLDAVDDIVAIYGQDWNSAKDHAFDKTLSRLSFKLGEPEKQALFDSLMASWHPERADFSEDKARYAKRQQEKQQQGGTAIKKAPYLRAAEDAAKARQNRRLSPTDITYAELDRKADVIIPNMKYGGFQYTGIHDRIRDMVREGHIGPALYFLQALGYQGIFIDAFFDGMSDALYGDGFENIIGRNKLCGVVTTG